MGDASYAIEGWRVITAVGPHQMLLRSELSDRATARRAMDLPDRAPNEEATV
jgi:hypothetical protein